jgi:sulfur-oxidizing protein SoxA
MTFVGLSLLWALLAGTVQASATDRASAAEAANAPNTTRDARQSGRAFLSADLLRQQDDPSSSPIGLWLERGAAAWNRPEGGQACSSCHGPTPGVPSEQQVSRAAARYPRLDTRTGQLINLEDQIEACRSRAGRAPSTAKGEDEGVLALSAWLHSRAVGQPMAVGPPADEAGRVAWSQALERGAQAYGQRVGRMNLACVHCHDQNVGRNLRAEVISPGHPTGFPVYRLRWQALGSLERRLRACYSGVQAEMPPPGAAVLRELELFLKVRAGGMPLDGPSMRR